MPLHVESRCRHGIRCRAAPSKPPGDRPGRGAVVDVPTRTSEEIVTELGGFTSELGRVLEHHSPDALMQPARDGGWGVVEILPHLRDWEEIYLERVTAIVGQERPHLPAYDDELWAIERDYRGQDPKRTFEHFRRLRGELIEKLEGLPPDAWHRRAVHDIHGEITLQWLLDRVCDHDREHLDQIRDALA